MQQSLNALMERTGEEEEVAGETMAGGRRKAGKDYVFEAGRVEIERHVGNEENKCQIKIRSKRTDIVVHWRKQK